MKLKGLMDGYFLVLNENGTEQWIDTEEFRWRLALDILTDKIKAEMYSIPKVIGDSAYEDGNRNAYMVVLEMIKEIRGGE